MPARSDAGSGGDEAARQPDSAYRFPLPPHPIAAEQARLLTKIALSGWNVPEMADDALLIAAELVTNAMKIGDVFHIGLSWQGGAVLIEVRDSSEASPDPRRWSADRIDGRGLLLVEACAKDWGWRREDQGGKTVWALVGDRDVRGDPPGDATTAGHVAVDM